MTLLGELQKPPAPPSLLLKMGVVGALICAPALLGIVCHEILVLDNMKIGWAQFGLHPILMTISFGLLMPLAAISYRGLEGLLGISHDAAKGLHAFFMFAAVVCAVLGVIDMWIVHDRAKGSEFHFISVHSWVGMMVLVASVLQWVSGLSVFYLPASPKWLRRSWLPAHVALGSFSLFGGVAAIALGILSFDYAHGLQPAMYHTSEQALAPNPSARPHSRTQGWTPAEL